MLTYVMLKKSDETHNFRLELEIFVTIFTLKELSHSKVPFVMCKIDLYLRFWQITLKTIIKNCISEKSYITFFFLHFLSSFNWTQSLGARFFIG